MLVDVKPEIDSFTRTILTVMAASGPTRHSQGVYIAGNFHLMLPEREKWEQWDDDLPGPLSDVGPYGVCDSIEAFLEEFGAALRESTTHQYVIAFMPVRKREQSADGGWRWHKWGAYVGKQTPTCEYLHDEPVIEEVWCFHVYSRVAAQ